MATTQVSLALQTHKKVLDGRYIRKCSPSSCKETLLDNVQEQFGGDPAVEDISRGDF